MQEENLMHGIDVTHNRFFDQPKVKEAVAFAAEADKGKFRKNKEPYVTHCIETACIVEEVLDLADRAEYNSRYSAQHISMKSIFSYARPVQILLCQHNKRAHILMHQRNTD